MEETVIALNKFIEAVTLGVVSAKLSPFFLVKF